MLSCFQFLFGIHLFCMPNLNDFGGKVVWNAINLNTVNQINLKTLCFPYLFVLFYILYIFIFFLF